jgi:hypothetical protein
MSQYNENRKGVGKMIKKMLMWMRDNDRTAASIVSALSQPVADLVLTSSDAKDI